MCKQLIFLLIFQLIGSSLLFVHDTTKANVWLIDFGKTVPVPNGLTIDHKSPWEVSNHEDGYLIGVQNLIDIFSDVLNELRASTTTQEFLKTRETSQHDERSVVVKENESSSSSSLKENNAKCLSAAPSTKLKPEVSNVDNITSKTDNSKFS